MNEFGIFWHNHGLSSFLSFRLFSSHPHSSSDFVSLLWTCFFFGLQENSSYRWSVCPAENVRGNESERSRKKKEWHKKSMSKKQWIIDDRWVCLLLDWLSASLLGCTWRLIHNYRFRKESFVFQEDCFTAHSLSLLLSPRFSYFLSLQVSAYLSQRHSLACLVNQISVWSTFRVSLEQFIKQEKQNEKNTFTNLR